MHILDHIPLRYDKDRLYRELQIERLKGKAGEVEPLIEESFKQLEPKAAYIYLQVEDIAEDMVRLEGGYVLKGAILADKLRSTQTVAPYVVTIGSRLEEKVSELARSNLLHAWLLDRIGNHAVRLSREFLQKIVEEKLAGEVSIFSPGSGTGEFFGIEQQKEIFRILSPEDKIGVTLTDSYLMIPAKSVSGIFTSTQEKYVACQHCPREKCESRRAPFQGEYRLAHVDPRL